MEIVGRRCLLALCAALLGCQSETVARTEILLVVDSNLAVPGQLDSLDVHVEGPHGQAQDSHAELDTGMNALPRSVALVHEGGLLGPLHATVQGKLQGQLVLTRQARLSFVEGKTLVLPMHLVASCLGIECGDQTCTESGCTSLDIDPASLAPYAGVEPGLSADDGRDSQLDAAVADAAVANDAGGVGDAASRADAGAHDGGDAGARDANVLASDAGSSDGGARTDASTCTPTPEVCNALDDDCDGTADDGFDLSSDPNRCGSCTNRCTGATRTCCRGTCRNSCN